MIKAPITADWFVGRSPLCDTQQRAIYIAS